MIPLEVGNLDAIVVFIVLIMFGPPLLLTIIGFLVRKNYPTAAKVLFILATVYLIAGLGICGSIIG
jgi:hypothetical protein